MSLCQRGYQAVREQQPELTLTSLCSIQSTRRTLKVSNMSDSDPFDDPDNWDEWGYKPAQRDEPMSEEDDDD